MGRLQRHVPDSGVLSGRKAVADGLDYNLSDVVNQDMRQSSC